MNVSTNSVFISYRRSVSSFIARAVFQELRSRGIDVFMDVESIDSGQFDTVLLNQIAARPYFLLILTPGVLDRCIEAEDWLLREIESAWKLNRIIIPLTTPEFNFNDAKKYLPESLASDLARYNSVGIIHEYFDAGMDKLCKRFLLPTNLPITPTPQADRAEVEERIEQIAAEPEVTEEQLTAQSYFERAYNLVNSGDYQIALTNYNEAIRLNPEFAAAYNNRGNVRHKLHDEKGAIADYSESIRLNPRLAQAYNNRGIILNEREDYKGAISDFTAALRIDPNMAEAYNNRGVAHVHIGDFKAALSDYTETLRINSLLPDAYTNRGNVRRIQRDYQGAMVDYTDAIRLAPDDPKNYFNRAVTYLDLEDHDAAIADYEIVLECEPENVDAWSNLAEAYLEVKLYRQAISRYQHALELAPHHPMSVAGLALAYLAIARTEEAQRLWQSLIASDNRYRDPQWVGKKQNWTQPLVEQARKLIESLRA